MRLEGKVAIVTGADSGIGRATAEAFAREGAKVAITYLHDHEGAEETLRRVEAHGAAAIVLQLDQRQPEEVTRMFRDVVETLGAPDLLVNNAAVGGKDGPVADMSDEDWDNVIRTNLHGPFYCCREFIRCRRAAGGHGRIINVTSVHEKIPMPDTAAYNASKGGLRNLTRTLALELAADRINVNNIAPGMILTPMNPEAMDDPAVREASARHIPWGRAGEPREVAELAVYLASDDADYATGQTFTLDGGLTMNVGQGA
jgi:glucose 1-dehydrogenase